MDSVVWTPPFPHETQMWRFMAFVIERHSQELSSYEQLHAWSVSYPAEFWQTLCDFYAIQFDTPAEKVLVQQRDMINTQWFLGARFNFAEKLLSRRDAHPALVCRNETHARMTLSYAELYLQVAECAQGLKELGIVCGDRVAALMPNTATTIIAMLAVTSLGAIWSSCSPDFGAQAAIDRLGQIEPRVLFICDGHQYQGKRHPGAEKIRLLTQAMPSLTKVIICPTIDEKIDFSKLEKAIYWNDFIKPAQDIEFASLPFNHPVYILFSSGTTGKPKCIMHSAGGTYLQHVKELGLHTDLCASDNLCYYTTCGWMMWNWMVSGLALGATLTLYEGCPTYPDNNILLRLVDEEKVTVFGTSAKFISALDKGGAKPRESCDLSSLRCILSTGSPLLPKNYDFVYEQIKSTVQLSSISGGTDIVSCFALGNPILPVRRGELQCIGLGMDVAIFDEQGMRLPHSRGELVCLTPLPSMPVGFWNDPEKKAYKKAYFNRFPNVWAHGDFAEITEHQGLIIYGRSDAVLNPGGVRIGTAEIYRQVEKVDGVVDSIVVGQDWDEDIRVVLFVKLREGLVLNSELISQIKTTIRKNASPRHVPSVIVQVGDIPRTMSGKIVELAVRQVIHNQTVNNLQSLANPEALNYFKNRSELSR